MECISPLPGITVHKGRVKKFDTYEYDPEPGTLEHLLWSVTRTPPEARVTDLGLLYVLLDAVTSMNFTAVMPN